MMENLQMDFLFKIIKISIKYHWLINFIYLSFFSLKSTKFLSISLKIEYASYLIL